MARKTVSIGNKNYKAGSKAANAAVAAGGKVSTSSSDVRRNAEASKARTSARNASDPLTVAENAGLKVPERIEPGQMDSVVADLAAKGAPVSPTETPTAPTGAQAGQLSYEQAQQNLAGGGLTGSALTAAQGTLASKYGQAFQALKAGGTPPPTDGGAARGMVAAAMPTAPDETAVDALYAENPELQAITQLAADYFSPDNQKSTLLQEYKKLEKQSGLAELDEEIIDAETIIDGTEDDIRNEVQMAGGMATDSQVMAMSLARNKSLLKRYNQMVSMRQQTKDRLDMMMNLTAQDRKIAEDRFNTQISLLTNFANFRQQATNAAKETYRWNMEQDPMGFYKTLSADPRQLGYAERIMGLSPGGLKSMATAKAQERANQQYMQSLQIRKAEADLAAAAGTTEGGQSPEEQIKFLRNTVQEAKNLSSGAGASPAINWLSRNLFGATEKDRLATQVRTLSSNMLTLATDPNIKKFFGPQMSDADVKQMLAAGTTLNVDEMNKADLEAELDRLDKIFAKLEGVSSGMNVYDPSGGTWVVEQ